MYQTIQKRFTNDKRSSLFVRSVGNLEKLFNGVDIRKFLWLDMIKSSAKKMESKSKKSKVNATFKITFSLLFQLNA